jgi:hypothetical protein
MFPEYSAIDEETKKQGRKQCFISHGFAKEEGLVEDLREAVQTALSHEKIQLEPYFADDHLATDSLPISKLYTQILISRACLVDLTGSKNKANLEDLARLYFELGLMIGLNKPVVITRSKDASSKLPGCLEGYAKIVFSGYSSLKKTLIEYLPKQLEDSIESQLFHNFCHFMDVICEFRPRDRHKISPTVPPTHKSLLIDLDTNEEDNTDSDLVEFLEELLTPKNLKLVPLAQVPANFSNTNRQLCNFCCAVRESKLAITHFAPNSSPTVYLLFGLAIGSGIPHIQIKNQRQGDFDHPTLLDIFGFAPFNKRADLKKMVDSFNRPAQSRQTRALFVRQTPKRKRNAK